MLTVYSTITCQYCPLVKRYLATKGVEFKEVDVTQDQALRIELQRRTGMSTVPITVADDGRFSVGWKVQELANLIK